MEFALSESDIEDIQNELDESSDEDDDDFDAIFASHSVPRPMKP